MSQTFKINNLVNSDIAEAKLGDKNVTIRHALFCRIYNLAMLDL